MRQQSISWTLVEGPIEIGLRSFNSLWISLAFGSIHCSNLSLITRNRLLVPFLAPGPIPPGRRKISKLPNEARDTPSWRNPQRSRRNETIPLFHRSLPFFLFLFSSSPLLHTIVAETDRSNQYHGELVSPSRGQRAHATKTSFSARIPGRRLDIIIRGSPWPRRLPSIPIVPRRTSTLATTFFHTRFGELY